MLTIRDSWRRYSMKGQRDEYLRWKLLNRGLHNYSSKYDNGSSQFNVCFKQVRFSGYKFLRVKHLAATICFPGLPSGWLRLALQTAPNAPDPITSRSAIRLREISHSSTSWFSSSISYPCSSSGLNDLEQSTIIQFCMSWHCKQHSIKLSKKSVR